MRTPYRSRNILDECLLSSSKWSAECIHEQRFLQAMKHGDSLLLAWQTTISRKGDDAAVFDATGRIARTFRDIEGHARAFEAKMDKLLPGAELVHFGYESTCVPFNVPKGSCDPASCIENGGVIAFARDRRLPCE